MFSKFDTQISSDEVSNMEPTQAEREEYQAWLEEQEAGEPEPSPEDWNVFDGHLDFYADMEEAYDESDLYGAEYENFAVREWDWYE